ncbi:MAG: Na+/H+ antiporter [Candidatus Dasytiphilus stammeri]
MEIFFNILIMMLVVSVSGMAQRFIHYQMPLPLLQIAAGTIMACPTFGLHIDFDSELFLIFLVPPLLFVDAWKIPASEFMQHRREIIGLAFALVIVTIVGIGYLIYWIIPGINLISAFCLASVLSPTDAVALTSLVGEGRIPKKIMAILQGEALMNDASSLVALKFTVAMAVGEMQFSLSDSMWELIKVFLGGVIAGITITLLYGKTMHFMSRWSYDDPVTQIIFLLLLPFATSLVAENAELSGILAAVAAGMTVSRSGMLRHAPLPLRLRAHNVWMMLESLFNGTVFVLLGLQLPRIIKFFMIQIQTASNNSKMKFWMPFLYVVLVYMALVIVRLIWLLTMRYISRCFLTKNPLEFVKYTWRDLFIASFAGVRGAITLAGVLSIPTFIHFNEEFPARNELIFLASGVILFSLLIGMIILPFLLRGVSLRDKFNLNREIQQARSLMASVAIKSLYKMEERLTYDTTKENIDTELVQEASSRVIGYMRRRLLDDEGKTNIEQVLFVDDLERRFRLTGIRAERGEVFHLRATKQISDETMHKLLYELDLQEELLKE